MYCRYGLQQTDGANEFIPSIVEGFRKEIKLCTRGRSQSNESIEYSACKHLLVYFVAPAWWLWSCWWWMGNHFASSMPAFRNSENPIYDHLHCATKHFYLMAAASFLAGPGLAKWTLCFKIGFSVVAVASRNSSTDMARRTKARHLPYGNCGLTWPYWVIA